MAAAGYTHRFHHVGRFCFSDLSQGPLRQILTELRLALLEWAWSGMRQVRRLVAIVSYLLVVSNFKPSKKYSSKFESSPNGSGWKQTKSWNHNLDNQIITYSNKEVKLQNFRYMKLVPPSTDVLGIQTLRPHRGIADPSNDTAFVPFRVPVTAPGGKKKHREKLALRYQKT